MYNSTTRKEKSPEEIDQKALRAAWIEKQTKLNAQKEELGYKDTSLKEFLALEPNEHDSHAKASQLIALQEKINDLLIEQDAIWIEETVVNELNKKHAVLHTDQFYILTEKDDIIFGGKNFVLESKASFKSQYENKLVMWLDGKPRIKAEIWLKSPLRREYKNITFDPKTDPQVLESQGLYNIWKGFVKNPKNGDASKYWKHAMENICNKDEKSYGYVRKWLASIFQHPDKVHTALVLCGSQGTGKNAFVNPLGVLLGQHYAPLGNVSELVSNFNFHLKNAVLIHANEAFWGGHKKEIGTLKTMITEETCLIEAKGKDRILVKNYKHVIMSSNEDWPVHLDPDDRRFYVLRISENHKEDVPYFEAIQDQLNNGGYEALLYDLLNEDLTQFDPRRFPGSTEAFDIKIRSADSTHIYIYEALRDGCFYIGIPYDNARDLGVTQEGIWRVRMPKNDIFKDYVVWCKVNGYKHEPNNQFGKVLKKLIPSTTEARPSIAGIRVWSYILPSLEDARQEFCKVFKETERIWADEDTTQEVP